MVMMVGLQVATWLDFHPQENLSNSLAWERMGNEGIQHKQRVPTNSALK